MFVGGRRRETPERFDHTDTMALSMYLIAHQPLFFRKRQLPTTHGCGQCGSCVGHRSARLSNRLAIRQHHDDPKRSVSQQIDPAFFEISNFLLVSALGWCFLVAHLDWPSRDTGE